jgi:glycosyltransferase involved in cell wall biosynthesis
VQREANLIGPPWLLWFLTRVLRRPLVLDLDDATYLDMPSPIYGRLATLLKWRGRADRLIDHSAYVICGNEWIAAHVRGRGGRAVVLPTIVDTDVFTPRNTAGRDARPVIGWIGTHSTWRYVEEVLPVLERLAAHHDFRFRVVGSGRGGVVSELPPAAVGFDAGCGAGRWASLVAPRGATGLPCCAIVSRKLRPGRRSSSISITVSRRGRSATASCGAWPSRFVW